MRYSLPVAALFALLAVACSGSKSPAPTPTATRTVSAAALIPTPTAVPYGLAVLQVAAGKAKFAPSASQFLALPQTQVKVDGKSYKGVTLATLAGKVSAPASSVATVFGTVSTGTRVGGVTLPLKTDGNGTIFSVDNNGHISMATSGLPAPQWLISITAVSFQ